MSKEENKEIVWASLTQELKSDRSRTNILKISDLGLVEMTRKRVRENLIQTLCDPCPYCDGRGHIKSPTTVCYEIIRALQRIGKDSLNKKTITLEIHPVIYDILVEEESAFLDDLAKKHMVEVNIQVNPKLHQEKYNIIT